MGKQYDKQHSVTVVATSALSTARFCGFDGAPATSAGGSHDAQGVTETEAAIGGAVSVVTGYSAAVEAGAAIEQFAYVKPAADGSGKAITGASGECCGIALEAATGDGDVIEVRILPHRHAA